MFFEDTIAEMGKFMDSGGMVLWAIVVLLFLMWTLIFERMWYLRSIVGVDVNRALTSWSERSERKSKHAHQIREKLISEVSIEIDANMMMIKTLVAVAPLFGLLGTVTGMITVFDVMAFTGGGDAKAMAGGVSQATIPTMSGMVAALSGVFGMTYIERVAEREKHLLEDHLILDH
ncbi:MAG: MotA/TolQ/ExbB proton channel family protein [Porticoccaceae bacterium]|nr:MotA/TolQ/ExbB proton channel family protein [Porticoccaceae bacterium]MDG1475159.1 MotA/TolQ/ExbB proton channel family protein [Porticoccaceae bacterium]